MRTPSSSSPWLQVVCSGLLVVLIFGASSARAQTAAPSPTPTGTVATGPGGFWRCELPGGVYLVALRNLQSVSSHEYVVDGAARVTEVTVATASSVEARFYYLEPVGLNPASPLGQSGTLQAMQQRVQDLSASHGPVEPVWEKVVKSYPASTHAHTVEFRLTTRANLQQLEQSLEQAWISGKGVSIKSE